MSHTVIGIFDTSNEAQTALQQLVSAGISRDNIDIKPRTEKSGDVDNDGDEDSISKFFSNLFGGDDRSERYSNYARTTGSVVTVHARSAQEAEQAADILDAHGAVDVDERTSGVTGTTAGYSSGTTGVTGTGAGSVAGTGTGYTAGTTGTTETGAGYGAGTTGTGAGYVAGAAAGAAASAMSDSTHRDRDTNRTSDKLDNLDSSSTDTSIPIIEEELQVGKRTVETGGVRVRSRIIERPVEEHLRLREEHVHIERTPTDRPATDADFASFKEGDVEITERAEVPVVNKESHVVEEVRITKDVEEHDEQIRDTVHKTEVDIDKLSEEELRRHRSGGDSSHTNRSADDSSHPHRSGDDSSHSL